MNTKVVALALVALFALAGVANAAESVPIPANVNCNRTCWKKAGLEGLKKTIFKLCKANARVIETMPGKYGCGTYIYYRFNTNAELRSFQDCQSKQKLFIDQVLNKGYKTPLTSPPKYARC